MIHRTQNYNTGTSFEIGRASVEKTWRVNITAMPSLFLLVFNIYIYIYIYTHTAYSIQQTNEWQIANIYSFDAVE